MCGWRHLGRGRRGRVVRVTDKKHVAIPRFKMAASCADADALRCELAAAASNGTVVLTATDTSPEFEELVDNWACHLQRLSIPPLVWALDAATHRKLQSKARQRFGVRSIYSADLSQPERAPPNEWKRPSSTNTPPSRRRPRLRVRGSALSALPRRGHCAERRPEAVAIPLAGRVAAGQPQLRRPAESAKGDRRSRPQYGRPVRAAFRSRRRSARRAVGKADGRALRLPAPAAVVGVRRSGAADAAAQDVRMEAAQL